MSCDLQRRIPWRVLHELDNESYPVCNEAANYIDSMWDIPCVDVYVGHLDVLAAHEVALLSLCKLRKRLQKQMVRWPSLAMRC
jgi:Putative zinc-RING and/or ribbon